MTKHIVLDGSDIQNLLDTSFLYHDSDISESFTDWESLGESAGEVRSELEGSPSQSGMRQTLLQ